MKTLLTLTIGAALSAAAIKEAVVIVEPTMLGAIQHQEDCVRVAEELGLSCAIPARKEWDQNKATALFRIECFKSLLGSITDGDATIETPNQ